MKKLTLDIFQAFNDGWALVTAGSPEHYNTMTVSWGSLGTIWSRPIATVYVKPIRYTHEFLDANEYFTVTFFEEKYRQALGLLGSRSGRDGDKVAASGLHPVKVGETVGFQEARTTLLCRKIYRQDMKRDFMPPEVVEHYYEPEEPHTMYIGEVIDIL